MFLKLCRNEVAYVTVSILIQFQLTVKTQTGFEKKLTLREIMRTPFLFLRCYK